MFFSQKNRDLIATSFSRQDMVSLITTGLVVLSIDHWQKETSVSAWDEAWNVGGYEADSSTTLPPNVWIGEKHISNIPRPGCRFYEWRESGIPENTK